jgi:predicted MFS family arabinose efflux permease
MIGLFNIIGSVAMGWAIGRWRMKSLLSLVYATRALAVLVFLLAPKTGPVVLVFAAVMGLTFLSTVPPTAGLVAKFFGPANMATLFGVVMLTHQVGAFFGSWLGGKVYEWTGPTTGSGTWTFSWPPAPPSSTCRSARRRRPRTQAAAAA